VWHLSSTKPSPQMTMPSPCPDPNPSYGRRMISWRLEDSYASDGGENGARLTKYCGCRRKVRDLDTRARAGKVSLKMPITISLFTHLPQEKSNH